MACGCTDDSPTNLPSAGGGYTVTYEQNGVTHTERYGSYVPAQRRAKELGLPPSAVVDAN